MSPTQRIGLSRYAVVVTVALVLASACESAEYAIGADVSYLKHSEDRGVVFKYGGRPKPALRILEDHGYTWVRLRLFHSPTELPNDRAYTIHLARAAKAMGFKFLLNLHYSDTWADPGHQTIPAAWAGKPREELRRLVFTYTKETIAAFREAGAMPDMVQIGNEVVAGMLWPNGRLPEHWDEFTELVRAATRGVDEGRANARRPRIMVHIDRGGDVGATSAFFDSLEARGVDYDVIGQSYYPWWHGSLDQLRSNLAFMAKRYRKDIVLAEVAYCWRPTEYRDRAGPFPETPVGQKQFLEQVDRAVRETPGNRGAGIFWWEPAVLGPLRSRGFFDDDGNALPVLNAFDR